MLKHLIGEIHMLRVILLTSFAVLFSGTSMAATMAKVECSKSPVTKFKPQTDLIAMLKTKGITVSKIKVEGGCYETYAKDGKGKKMNAAYNAETLEMLDNAEGGEAPVVKKK
jgi:hypothetical protein